MIPEISAVVATLDAAKNIAKDILGSKIDKGVQLKTNELVGVITALNGQILSLQSTHSELLKSRDEWKHLAEKKKEWAKTKATYKPHCPTPGVAVYISDNCDDPSQPHEWLCKHCADINKEPSTLQLANHSAAGQTYKCHNCDFGFKIPEPRTTRTRAKPSYY
jgi:hypothetical protein